MHFFENELKKIIHPFYPNATYVSRTCYIPLGGRITAKIQFDTSVPSDNYDTLQITILNRITGPIDNIRMSLKDLLGKPAVSNPYFPNGICPHICETDAKVEWYVYEPTACDYQTISNAIVAYLSVFQNK